MATIHGSTLSASPFAFRLLGELGRKAKRSSSAGFRPRRFLKRRPSDSGRTSASTVAFGDYRAGYRTTRLLEAVSQPPKNRVLGAQRPLFASFETSSTPQLKATTLSKRRSTSKTIEAILSDWLQRVETADTDGLQVLRRDHSSYEAALYDPSFHEVIHRIYADSSVLTHSLGHTIFRYPCIAFRVNGAKRGDLEGIISPRPVHYASTDRLVTCPDYARFLRTLTQKEHEQQNKPPPRDPTTYAMSALLIKEAFVDSLDCYPATYWEGQASCEYLRFELCFSWQHNRQELLQSPSPLDLLPHRKALHTLEGSSPLSHKGRTPTIAISTLVCYRHATGEHRCILYRRAKRFVASMPGLYHVVPAGMFQNHTTYAHELYSIRENVLREFAEELFDEKQPPARTVEDVGHWYRSRRCVIELERLMGAGTAVLEVTGVAIDLFNLRPEICTLLFIDDPHWKDTQGNLVTELEYGDDGQDLPLDDDTHASAHFHLLPTDFIPAGAAALWLGLPRARELSAMFRGGYIAGTATPVTTRPQPETPHAREVAFLEGRTPSSAYDGSTPLSQSEIARIIATQQQHIDLLVNEITGTIERRGSQPSTIARGMASNMLWLVLTHQGGRIEECDVASFTRRGHDDPEPKTLRKYVEALRHLIGTEIANRFFPFGESFPYSMFACRWSYLWVRSSREQEKSLLLKRPQRSIRPSSGAQ